MLISDPPYLASRLGFDCTPRGTFLGLRVRGERISFAENVIYEFRSEKIVQVWSVIDSAAIERSFTADLLEAVRAQIAREAEVAWMFSETLYSKWQRTGRRAQL